MISAMLTGHRTVDDNCVDGMCGLIRSLKEQADNNDKDLIIISGGNLGTRHKKSGADRMWALAAHRMQVPYHIYVPLGYGDHYYGHDSNMLNAFNAMLKRADSVKYTPNVLPFNWKHNFQRNVAMVRAANVFVVCSNKPPQDLLMEGKGGTVHAVKEMKTQGVKEVHWIDATSGEYKGVMPLT